MSTLQSTRQETNTARPAVDVLRLISLILIVIGIAVSGYLSYVKLTNVAMICAEGGAFNCDVVQNSAYSRLLGIPIAYMGLATYLVMGGLLLFGDRIPVIRDYNVVLFFAINLFAFLFSMWLVYVQVGILEALCVWCLAHEVIITILFVISILRLRRHMSA